MPTNEILAPYYLRVKYATPAYPLGHSWVGYFAAGTTVAAGAEGDEDNLRLSIGGDDLGALSGIVHQIFTRAAGRLPADTNLTEIALWRSFPSAPNALHAFIPLPETMDYGTGSGFAAAYNIGVYGAALRNYYRCTFFDGGDAKPQRYPPNVAPDGDDGSLVWYLTKGTVPWATNDGLRLIRQVSENTGYNRKLARSYGRTITP